MKPRRNRVKTNRRGTKHRMKNRRNTNTRKRRRGGNCEDTNQRSYEYVTQFLYK